MNRRRFLGLGMGIVGSVGAASTPSLGETEARADADSRSDVLPGRSVDRAYGHLTRAMDAYQRGETPRLVQSYADQALLGSTAFTADSALAIIAYLERRRPNEVLRARLLGDSLLYAQAHDPVYSDGRVRAAYWVGPFTQPDASNDAYFVRPDGTVNLVGAPWFFVATSVGDAAWSAIALARLYARTGEPRYLDGALRLATWIVDNAFDTVGLGGYSFGVSGDNQRISRTKSGEHNILVSALFTNLLAPLTGDPGWASLGQHAREFVERLWNPDGGFFWVGSNDGTTINPSPLAENVQSFSFLALGDPRFASALDWAKTNLATTDTPQSPHASFTGNLRFSGVTFSDLSRRPTEPTSPTDPRPDPAAVWFEGTGQLAAALLERGRRPGQDLPTFLGDAATALQYLSHASLAQAELGRGQSVNGGALPDGSGLVAASSTLDTGFGFSVSPVRHVGATSWYLIAVQGANPYRLGG